LVAFAIAEAATIKEKRSLVGQEALEKLKNVLETVQAAAKVEQAKRKKRSAVEGGMVHTVQEKIKEINRIAQDNKRVKRDAPVSGMKAQLKQMSDSINAAVAEAKSRQKRSVQVPETGMKAQVRQMSNNINAAVAEAKKRQKRSVQVPETGMKAQVRQMSDSINAAVAEAKSRQKRSLRSSNVAKQVKEVVQKIHEAQAKASRN